MVHGGHFSIRDSEKLGDRLVSEKPVTETNRDSPPLFALSMKSGFDSLKNADQKSPQQMFFVLKMIGTKDAHTASYAPQGMLCRVENSDFTRFFTEFQRLRCQLYNGFGKKVNRLMKF